MDLPKVRIEVGPSAIFTRVYVNDVEFKGVTRVWFDSGEVDSGDGPRRSYRNTTRIHLDFYAQDLLVTGNAEVDALEVRPVPV
jgi:hypothetical protein